VNTWWKRGCDFLSENWFNKFWFENFLWNVNGLGRWTGEGRDACEWDWSQPGILCPPSRFPRPFTSFTLFIELSLSVIIAPSTSPSTYINASFLFKILNDFFYITPFQHGLVTHKEYYELSYPSTLTSRSRRLDLHGHEQKDSIWSRRRLKNRDSLYSVTPFKVSSCCCIYFPTEARSFRCDSPSCMDYVLEGMLLTMNNAQVSRVRGISAAFHIFSDDFWCPASGWSSIWSLAFHYHSWFNRQSKTVGGPQHLMTLFFLPLLRSLLCGLHEYGHSPVYKCFSVEHMKDHLTMLWVQESGNYNSPHISCSPWLVEFSHLYPLLSVILEHCSKNIDLFFPSCRVFSIGDW